jgi:hypothetical protein
MYAPIARAATIVAVGLTLLTSCSTAPAKHTVIVDLITDFEDITRAKEIALSYLGLGALRQPMLGPVRVMKCLEGALPDCAAYVSYCGYGLPLRETLNGSYRIFVPYEGVDASISERRSPC